MKDDSLRQARVLTALHVLTGTVQAPRVGVGVGVGVSGLDEDEQALLNLFRELRQSGSGYGRIEAFVAAHQLDNLQQTKTFKRKDFYRLNHLTNPPHMV